MKNQTIIFLFCLAVFCSCGSSVNDNSINRRLFDNYNDTDKIRLEVNNAGMDLKVAKDDRFVWIYNIDNIKEVQADVNKAVDEILEKNKSICEYDIKSEWARVIICYFKKIPEKDKFNKALDLPFMDKGDAGYYTYNIYKYNGRPCWCNIVYGNEEVGNGTIIHEITHVLTRISYGGELPYKIDECLVKAISPFDPTLTFKKENTVTVVNYYSYSLGNYLKQKKDPSLDSLITDINKENINSYDAGCLFFRYVISEGKMRLVLDDYLKRKVLRTDIIEKIMGSDKVTIYKHFEKWLRQEKYI
ncbi:MAG: hypothetical protein V1752_01915 [Candidatus Firestonebacteria bacterium]